MFYLKRVKEEQKSLGKEIRELKNSRKLSNRGDKDLSDIEYNIWKKKGEYRHVHIAYCELRGRSRDQIEKPRDYNKPDNRYIQKLKDIFLAEYEKEHASEQVICDSAN